VLTGCAENEATQARNLKQASDGAHQQLAARAEAPPAPLRPAEVEKRQDKEDAKPNPSGDEPNQPVARKKITTGRIELTVEKFDTAVRDIKELVKIANGYVANSDDSGSSGGSRVGTYTVRVPSQGFDKFMDDVALFGEVRHRTSDTQDITDQYYDTAAHVKNDEVRLQGLQKLYDITAQKGRIEDLLAVDREMSGVTGRIDQQKGQIKRWDKEVELSTVVVVVSQRTEYEAAGTPTFGTTISRTWDGSLNALASFGKALLLIAVALAPWLAVLAVVTVPLWIFLWWRVRKSRTGKRPTPTPPAPPRAEPPVAPLPA
jgi:hypothetical protein